MSYMTPEERIESILEAAAEVARETSINEMTRAAVARAANCSPGLIGHYFKSFDALRAEVINRAIHRNLDEHIAIQVIHIPEYARQMTVELHRKIADAYGL